LLGWHVVWCPRYRKGVLGGSVALRLFELADQIAAENDWQIVASEVIPDHVHIVVRVRPTDWPAEVARRSKDLTSPDLRAEFARLGRRRERWSKSYFAASGGYGSEGTVRRFIEHQWGQAA
jgi:putative transposase